NGAFFAQVQSNNPSYGKYGGFGVYKGSGPDQNFGRIWEPKSFISTTITPFYLAIQPDANLCVYQGTPTARTGTLWCSMVTRSQHGNFFVAMQPDGNLCVYAGSGPADNNGTDWCSMSQPPIIWITNGK